MRDRFTTMASNLFPAHTGNSCTAIFPFFAAIKSQGSVDIRASKRGFSLSRRLVLSPRLSVILRTLFDAYFDIFPCEGFYFPCTFLPSSITFRFGDREFPRNLNLARLLSQCSISTYGEGAMKYYVEWILYMLDQRMPRAEEQLRHQKCNGNF